MYSKGISWIDDCRIPFVDGKDSSKACKSDKDIGDASNVWLFVDGNHKRTGSNPQGRFPANLLVSDDMLNDGVISISQGGNSTAIGGTIFKIKSDETKLGKKSGFGDKGSNSRYYNIDKWFENLIK